MAFLRLRKKRADQVMRTEDRWEPHSIAHSCLAASTLKMVCAIPTVLKGCVQAQGSLSGPAAIRRRTAVEKWKSSRIQTHTSL